MFVYFRLLVNMETPEGYIASECFQALSYARDPQSFLI